MARSAPIPDRIAAQAADWTVRLSASDPQERENARAGFEAWQQQNPLHAAAAQRMRGVMDRMAGLRSASGGHTAPARAAFQAAFTPPTPPTQRRNKRVAAALLALVLALLPGWLLWQAYPPSYLAADLRTATGQWQTRTLEDGSRITLGSASAVNLHFDAQRRTLVLVQGDILVDVAHDAQRPFVVETPQGRIRALGTRFSVDVQADSTVLTMLESSVWVQTSAQQGSSEGITVQAGQRLRIHADGVGALEAVDARSVQDAWKFHQLVARDLPLPEVLDVLGRHRRGHIVYNRAQLENIRMLAVLPLDDTDRALQLLTDSLPALRVRSLTPYLVLVDAPPRP